MEFVNLLIFNWSFLYSRQPNLDKKHSDICKHVLLYEYHKYKYWYLYIKSLDLTIYLWVSPFYRKFNEYI